jgi:hypothetical protein
VTAAFVVLALVAAMPWIASRGRAPDAARARRASGRGVDAVDAVGLLDLVGAALTTGAAVPRALAAVGRAVGGPDGERLCAAAAALPHGVAWDVAWGRDRGRPPRPTRSARRVVVQEAWQPLADALEPVWTAGASPGPLLRAQADALRARRRAETRTAAARLGVRLVLPLGLCFLPAFVLVGLVPVVLALVQRLG